MRVPDAALGRLGREGYAVVPGLVAPDQLAAAREQLFGLVPTPEAYAADPDAERPSYLTGELPFGDGAHGFGLQDLAVCDTVVDYAERRCGTTDILITQALYIAKYPAGDDFEQKLHVDYHNNLLDYPRNDATYPAAQLILYLSDVDETRGPTYVVPWSVTGDDPVEQSLDRQTHAGVYAHEVAATGAAGVGLLYTMSTYHRGSRYLAGDGARFSLHLVFKAADRHDISWSGWAKAGPTPAWREWLSSLTARQRQLFGFPAPGDPYWNERTLAGVARRYPNMDMSPYLLNCCQNVGPS